MPFGEGDLEKETHMKKRKKNAWDNEKLGNRDNIVFLLLSNTE